MAEERVQRKLAAILVADVIGYSRLVGEDQQCTLATPTNQAWVRSGQGLSFAHCALPTTGV